MFVLKSPNSIEENETKADVPPAVTDVIRSGRNCLEENRGRSAHLCSCGWTGGDRVSSLGLDVSFSLGCIGLFTLSPGSLREEAGAGSTPLRSEHVEGGNKHCERAGAAATEQSPYLLPRLPHYSAREAEARRGRAASSKSHRDSGAGRPSGETFLMLLLH